MCGKEVQFPFYCNYCDRAFCAEHRLPENHQCPNLPKTPPPHARGDDGIPKLGLCPRCHYLSGEIVNYDADMMTFECKKCGFKFGQLKALPYDYVEPKDTKKNYTLTPAEKPEPSTKISPISSFGLKRDKPRRQTRYPAKTVVRALTGLLIMLLGVGVILWEIYYRLLWTIGLLWFIPIPMIFVGGIVVAFGAFFFLRSLPTFSGSLSTRKRLVVGVLMVLISGFVLWNVPLAYDYVLRISGSAPSHDELVNYTLSLINSDRTSHGLQNVSLSLVDSAQKHADDMLEHDFFSHWDTNGYKPYMRYTLAGGEGAVAENIAAFTQGAPSDLRSALKSLEWSMMNDDAQWNWGHRDNILDAFHNRVSIGISYDDNRLYFVQDFTNEYVQWSTFDLGQNGEVVLVGSLSKSLSLSQIDIFYDSVPSSLTQTQLENPPYEGAYTQGTFVGMALPYGYQSTQGITITAQTWTQSGVAFQIGFDLTPAFNMDGGGIYTLYLQSSNQDSLTSCSIWHG